VAKAPGRGSARGTGRREPSPKPLWLSDLFHRTRGRSSHGPAEPTRGAGRRKVLLSQNLGFAYPLRRTLTYTQSRGVLLHIWANVGVCPKTAPQACKSTVSSTQSITKFIFLIRTHRYSIK